MSTVPVHIRPHLVPFFLKEFNGREAVYLNQKVTAIKISTSSSLGRMMRLFMIKVDLPEKDPDYYNIYLAVEDTPTGKKYEGNYYKYESGARSFLKMPEDVNRAINDLLEDIFRTSFVYYVDGYMLTPGAKIIPAIDSFIKKYDLLEFGHSTESMRQLYYREKKKAV
ncbi:hypothetical protein [Flavobacterium rhizosphaerae]|uniref:Uncharacterized protein n=1 Tax=Flavobacterium rhizosphaerae TaxID=3163298 RepID=A0ABW8Z007_9FLAO